MKLSAVVVTYNNEDTIQECLASLKAQNIQDIIVVDNASHDGTVALCEQLHVTVIKEKDNKGFAHGVNVGLQYVTNPCVVLINPDAEIEAGALESAVSFLDTNPEVSVLGLVLVDEQDTPEKHSFGNPVTPLTLLTRQFTSTPYPSEPKEVGWVSGGAMVLRMSDIKKIDGFDEQFFLYWEDVDVCKRLRAVGKKIYLFPHIRVRHIRGASSSDKSAKTAIYDASADRYFRKHYSQPIWILQRILRRLYRLLRPQAL